MFRPLLVWDYVEEIKMMSSQRKRLPTAVIYKPVTTVSTKRMWCSEKRGISSVCLCLFLLSILVALASCQRGRFVNCKKMVFAPICRGVAAKRGGKMYYPNQSQLTYSQRSTNQYMPSEKQPPYWFFPGKTYP